MDPIYQYIIKRAKKQKLVINDDSINNLLSSINIVGEGEQKDYTLRFNKLSFLIYWLQFLKDHIHDLKKVYEGRWYGSNFYEYLQHLCEELKISEEIYNNLDSYLLQLYSQIDGEQIFFVEDDENILRYQENEVIINFEDNVLITTMNKNELSQFLKSIDCNLANKDITTLSIGRFVIKNREVMEQLYIFFYDIERRPEIDGAYQDFVKYFKLLLSNSIQDIGKGFPIFRNFISTNETKDFILTHTLTKSYKTSLDLSVTLDKIDGSALDELYDENPDLNFYIDQENHRTLPQTFPFFNQKTWSIGLLDMGQFFELEGFGHKAGNKDLRDLGEGGGKIDAFQLDVSECKINFVLEDTYYFEVGWFWNENGPNLVIDGTIQPILSAEQMKKDETFIGAFAKFSGDQMPMLYDCIITPNRFLLSGDKKNIEMGMSIHILIKLGLLELYKNEGGRNLIIEPNLKIIRERIAGLDDDESPLVIVTDQYHRKLAIKLSKLYKSREKIKQKIRGAKVRDIYMEEEDLEQAIYHAAIFFIEVYEIGTQIDPRDFMSILENYLYTKDLKKDNKIDIQIKKEFKEIFKTKHYLIYKQPKTLSNIVRMISYLNTDDDDNIFKERVFMKINELLVEEASSNSLSSNSETSIEEETSEEMGNEGEETSGELGTGGEETSGEMGTGEEETSEEMENVVVRPTRPTRQRKSKTQAQSMINSYLKRKNLRRPMDGGSLRGKHSSNSSIQTKKKNKSKSTTKHKRKTRSKSLSINRN